ncbi:MAG: sulfotransferase family protein, partial [Gammaproteobacteria bacterium]
MSSQAVRESSFDIEKTFFSDTSSYGDHVFVVGMARSGTTAILNAIHQSEEFASLSYQDMPFILAPNFWAKFSSKRDTDPMDREHEDGIKISVKSPEA